MNYSFEFKKPALLLCLCLFVPVTGNAASADKCTDKWLRSSASKTCEGSAYVDEAHPERCKVAAYCAYGQGLNEYNSDYFPYTNLENIRNVDGDLHLDPVAPTQGNVVSAP